MKKILVIILILVLINLFTTLFYISNSSKVIYSSDILTDKLADLLKDWYYKQHSTAFNNIIINVTLAKDIQNIKIENGLIEAVFYVKATMMPKLTFKDISKSPFLKGIQRYLEENKNILIDSQIKTLEILFKEKYEALKESIGKLHEENGIFKIICEISTSGDINESSKRIFYDVSVKGEPLWEEATNLYFITPLSYEEEENMGYEEAKNLIERLYKTIISSNEISPNGFYINLYNGNSAKNYADQYTTEASYNQYIICKWLSGGVWVEEPSHYTNINAWNNSQYPLTQYSDGKYEKLACYNCADYVSQAMYYGGMQADTRWNPSYRKTGAPDGKWYWTYVPDLLECMRDIRHDWANTTYSNSYKGDVIVWLDANNDPFHIAMIDDHYGYNGVYYNNFAAHTNDKRQHSYSPSSNLNHYNVSCWRWEP